MSVCDISLHYSLNMDNKLQNFLNSDNCFFIHYASDGFYNGSSPAPKLSCIVIYNFKNDMSYRFCINDYINGNSSEQAEKLMLENFKLIFDKFPKVCFIHWNMNIDGFGFKAIQARAKDFGIDLPVPDNDYLFNLSSYVSYLAEKKLSIKQILWFNSLLYGDDFLDGKTEAEYFKQGKYEEIYYSVDLKVHGFSEVVKLIQNNKLKTDAPYQNNDGLTKEEKRQQALKLAETREKIINDVYEHNRKLMEKTEYYECADNLFFFNSEHPVISLFASWFANR